MHLLPQPGCIFNGSFSPPLLVPSGNPPRITGGSFRLPTWLRSGASSLSRTAIARAFIAKVVRNLTTTRDLPERPDSDTALRQLCCRSGFTEIPSGATFSRAFATFAESEFPNRIHEAVVRGLMGDELTEHVSRDPAAIGSRGKPAPKPKAPEEPKGRRG